MNTFLKQNAIFPVPSPSLHFTRERVDTKGKAVSIPAVPSLEEILDQIGPLPRGSLFLGQAEDELPVLLDLSNPLPGPILIAGDAGAGKTRLLRLIAKFVVSMHTPQKIQYGVITACPHEWQDLTEFPHCVGIFSMEENGATNFLRALALWSHMQELHHQSVLLIIDGLHEFPCQNHAVNQDFRDILMHGPAKQIWPIATIDVGQHELAGDWLTYFHTRVFGYTRHPDSFADDCLAGFESLSKGIEFSLKARSRRIKFRVPSI